MTVLEVIAKSSNIGTIKCANLMSEPVFYGYMKEFGFGSPTGVDIPAEATGNLRPVSKWSKYSHASLAMGQEIAVTALQMATAFAAIANGGELFRPHILKKVVDDSGEVIGAPDRQAIRRVMSQETSDSLIRAMTEVVETGTGTRVKSDKFMIAGKTGTAQKQTPGVRGYADGKFIASFCGFAPATNPQICAIVVVDDPKGWSHFGGTVAGPAVKEILEQTLIYMRVPGDRKEENAETASEDEHTREMCDARR
jgi:cell division protein FtsI/penicillin-binding protein 2